MKKLFLYLLLVLPVNAAWASLSSNSTKVLMLISSHGTEERPELSYDLEELAQAYLVLHDNGVNLDIATPTGGPVLVKTNKDNLPFIQRFKSIALEQLQNTLPTSSIESEAYQGVFIVGGAGAMFDLPSDAATQAMLTEFAEKQTHIAAVCHGPAAIADIKMPDGKYFIAGKQVNSFTNVEERAFSGEHIAEFPFLLQDKLIENGGNFVHNDPMLPFVAVDGNLITAQNPPSVPKAAEVLLIKLGITPKPRDLFKDEATMQLLATAKDVGAVTIDLGMTKTPEAFDLNYLAIYGFYAYPLATDERKQTELELMVTIANYFQHPAYETALIKALHEQGHSAKAHAALQTFLSRYPSHEKIAELRSIINIKG